MHLLWPFWSVWSQGPSVHALVEAAAAVADGVGLVHAAGVSPRLPPLSIEQNKALATTPVQELLSPPFLQPDQIKDSLHAYQLSK